MHHLVPVCKRAPPDLLARACIVSCGARAARLSRLEQHQQLVSILHSRVFRVVRQFAPETCTDAKGVRMCRVEIVWGAVQMKREWKRRQSEMRVR